MYVPLDVNFPDDDKIETVGLAGSGLYAQALCIAKRTMSDGRLTLVKLHRLGADDELIAACVRADLFSVRADDPDAVWITAFLDHNDSAEAVEGKRANDAQRKRTTRRKRPRDVQPDAPAASENVQPLEVEVDTEVEVEGENHSPATSGTALELVPTPDAPASPERATPYPDDFETWWENYPRKTGKGAAAKAYRKARRAGVSSGGLLAAVDVHAEAWHGTDPQYIPHPATWLNEARYDDPPPTVTTRRPQGRAERNEAAIRAGLADAQRARGGA